MKKIIFLFVFTFSITIIFILRFYNSKIEAEDNVATVRDKIEKAKQIWEAEKLYKEGKFTELKKFKSGKSKNIRRFIVWELGNKQSKGFLEEREKIYLEYKNKINKMKITEKKKFLIDQLLNFDCKHDSLCVVKYEAAILLLTEIGNAVIPDILNLLDDPSNIPTKKPPPWDKKHTVFNILLKVLKSIPDKRSISHLQKLSNNFNEYVSEDAKESLKWIKSGVPYPFKYERIFLMAEDEIFPGEE